MNISSFRAALIPLSAVLSFTLTAAATAPAYAAPSAPGAEYQAFKIGSYSALALKDGTIQMPNDGKSFVLGHSTAEVSEALKAGGAPDDHFEFSIQPLLVHAGSHVLLIDAGAGNYFGATAGMLPAAMTAAGQTPASVTDIFISHAHGDHVGGLITSTGTLEFPNATIHMSAREWAWLSGMSATDAKMFGIPDVTVLVAAIRPKVVPFEPGAQLLPGIVKAVDIKGHTPGHSAYRIGSGSNTLLAFGDTLHSYVLSVKNPSWKIAFDGDQETGAASRTAFVARSAKTGQRLYSEHFPFPGVGKIVQDKSGYAWAPESLH